MANEPSPELVKQIKREFDEIRNAPPVIFGPTLPVCHFCGRIQASHEDLTPHVDAAVHEQGPRLTRYKGKCCGG